MTIEEKLDILAAVQKEQEKIRDEREAIYKALLTPSVIEALERAAAVSNAHGLESEAALSGQADALKAEIMAEVLAHGQSIKAAGLQAVYTKGASRWDSKKLETYATTHPELLEMKTTGEPSVSIRAAK